MGRVERHQTSFTERGRRAEKLFAVTKVENLFIVAQIHRLQSDFITKRTNVFINTKDCSLGGSPTTYSITVSDQFYYEHYYGRRAMLSFSNVLPLHGIPEGAIICNVEHHVDDCGALSGASRDYAIVISRNPNNGTSAIASRDYAIVISHNPDNGT